MKKLLNLLRLRKPDEMERTILFKSQRNAYLFLVFALIAWTFFESYRVYAYHDPLNSFPCLLLAAAALIQAFSQLILTRNAVKGDEDSFETGPLFRIIILSCTAAGIIATIATAILLAGVPA